jgi:Fe-Mn family superoxide dismutase
VKVFELIAKEKIMSHVISLKLSREVAPLPYAYNALEPYIDEQTMRVHHDKHHAAYLTNFVNALEKYPELLERAPEDLLGGLDSVPADIRTAVRNHGGGHAHHAMFWTLMKPNGGGAPEGEIAKLIKNEFGGFDNFKAKFNDLGLKHFGSGWVWLVRGAAGNYEILSMPNQDSPFSQGMFPVMCNDLWEHAYYLHYQNRRAEYLQMWWNVVNWEEINRRLKMAETR